jgi:hypothetical protein
MSSAAMLPAAAAPRHVAHFRGLVAERFGHRLDNGQGAAGSLRQHKAASKSASGTSPSDTQFTIIDAPDADPNLYGTRVFGINESGTISGQYVDANGRFRAFLRTEDNAYTPISVRKHDTFVGILNDKGDVYGSYYVDKKSGLEATWVRYANGKVKTIQPPDAVNGSFGQSVNNKSVVMGNYIDGNGAFHTFTYDKHGTLTELPDAPGAGSGEGQGSQGITINDAGEISGGYTDSNNVIHGFVRSSDGTYITFDVPGAGTGTLQGSDAVEMDGKGLVSGQYIDSNDVYHGFLCNISNCSDTFVSVDAPDAGPAPGQGTVAVEHHEAGWSVGEYIDSANMQHGFLRKNSGTIVEFDPPGVGGLGTYTVWSSNRDHQIAGTFQDENGIRHGFIRNP